MGSEPPGELLTEQKLLTEQTPDPLCFAAEHKPNTLNAFDMMLLNDTNPYSSQRDCGRRLHAAW
jgi:hypothetical protein